jgi:hypothetical protein
MSVGKLKINFHAALSGKYASLVLGCRRNINRVHVKPLLCKPDTVSSFTVCNR